MVSIARVLIAYYFHIMSKPLFTPGEDHHSANSSGVLQPSETTYYQARRLSGTVTLCDPLLQVAAWTCGFGTQLPGMY